MGISFFTPVKWEDPSSEIKPKLTCFQKIAQAAESYLYLGGRVAVVMPNSVRDGSHLVTLKKHKANVWLSALKVASYFTVVLPALALITKMIFRTNYEFHRSIAVTPMSSPPSPFVTPDDDYPSMAKAPLTLVRSPEQTSLKISILYNQKFSPIDPTEPKPSSVTAVQDVQKTSKHIWQVMTQGDGTLALQDGRLEKINMIWWEAQRHEAPTPIKENEAACIKREDIGDFLKQALRRQGVKEQEMEAFVQYWQTVLANDFTVASPYLLVQLVDSANISDYLPEMQVEGDKANDYTVNRFYFRFEPLLQPGASHISANEYLEKFAVQNLGERAVIDLGGEVNAPSTWSGQDAFNAAFIRKYIYAS
jgi:hypothetical protein